MRGCANQCTFLIRPSRDSAWLSKQLKNGSSRPRASEAADRGKHAYPDGELQKKGVTVCLGRTNQDLCPVAAILSYVTRRGLSPGPLVSCGPGRLSVVVTVVSFLADPASCLSSSPSCRFLRTRPAVCLVACSISVSHRSPLCRFLRTGRF